MKKAIFIIVCVEILLFSSYAHSMGRKPPVVVEDTDEGKIASHFNISEDMVIGLRNKEYSDEQVIEILILSTATGKSIKEITDLRTEGKSWEEIAQNYDVDVDMLNEETANILLYYGKIKKTEKSEEEKDIEEILPPKRSRDRKLDLGNPEQE